MPLAGGEEDGSAEWHTVRQAARRFVASEKFSGVVPRDATVMVVVVALGHRHWESAKLDTFMIAGGGLFFVISSGVGIRLLVLAQRNRALPELMLGIAFVVGGTIGGVLGQIVQTQGDRFSPGVAGQLLLVYGVVAVIGITTYNVFTWRVFQPEARWARLFVLTLFLCCLTHLGFNAVTGVYETGLVTARQRIVETALYMAGPVWATIEAFRHHGLLKKRLTLGLADPVVVNRMLLWGIGSLFASTIVLGSVVVVLFDSNHPAIQLSGLNIGLSGIVASTAYALAFFPPSSFLEWVRRSAVPQTSEA